MKNLISLLLLFALLGACSENEVDVVERRAGLAFEPNQEEPFTGTHVVYWDEEKTQKKMEMEYRNGKREGSQTVWHPNGKKRLEASFKGGKQDGPFTSWHENGQKESEGKFKGGRQDGLITHGRSMNRTPKTGERSSSPLNPLENSRGSHNGSPFPFGSTSPAADPLTQARDRPAAAWPGGRPEHGERVGQNPR